MIDNNISFNYKEIQNVKGPHGSSSLFVSLN